jgi:hypothetical protein
MKATPITIRIAVIPIRMTMEFTFLVDGCGSLAMTGIILRPESESSSRCPVAESDPVLFMPILL